MRQALGALGISILLCTLADNCLYAADATPSTPGKRLVVLKVDGLGEDVLARYVDAIDPATHKSRLPWIYHVFREGGTWANNFYVRGISLSVPSWSMLDTGYHGVIHGNAEYDRFTLHVYDYMNFFPFYLGYARARHADMPGVEVLDDAGIPLLSDRFSPAERFQGFQLFQRGVRWRTLQQGLIHRFKRSPSELLNEWESGFELSNSVFDEVQRELIGKLQDPKVRYLDIFFGDWDHLAHLTNDPVSQFAVLKQLDSLVGRIWTTIESSSSAQDTILVMVSDHGMNSDEKIYSQGYSLIDVLTSKAGGGHHVINNRHTLDEFKLSGLDPFVSEVTTESPNSYYLAGQSDRYPTALLDMDGNERANVYLRNSRLNEIQILLTELASQDVPRERRQSILAALAEDIDSVRPQWQGDLAQLRAELAAVHDEVAKRRQRLDVLPKKWTENQKADGQELAAHREIAHLQSLVDAEQGYGAYLKVMSALLALHPETAAGSSLHADIVPKRAMGPLNTIYDLQNYAIGSAPRGFVIDLHSGNVDWQRSFQRVDYFKLLTELRVRNTPQKSVGPRPVDFIATPIPRDAIVPALSSGDTPDEDAIWLYASPENQALILTRHSGEEQRLRYLPIRDLTQDRDGHIHFTLQTWREGFPLHLFEDPQLQVTGDRAAWLSEWHTEHEWFEAVAGTEYSNGIISLTEQFRYEIPPHGPTFETSALLDAFEQRRRNAVRCDMLVLASNHWNFNVRAFNPGGNHGAFFRISTHSTLLFAGSGIPAGATISAPYDSLNFVPTLLSLADPERACTGPPLPRLAIPKIAPALPCQVSPAETK